MRTLFMRVALLVLITVPLLVAQAGERKFEKKFTVKSGEWLTVATDLGSVRVVGGSGSEVSVLAELRGRQKDVDNFDITAEQVGGGVDVRGRGSMTRGWFWNSSDLDVRYTINVPHDFNVRLNTSGGNIEVGSLKGTVNGETSGGDIRLNEIEGKVDMHTSGGNIRVEKVKGEVRMETSGGEIGVNSVTGGVDVNTSGGNVRISDVDGNVKSETSGGNIYVKVTGGNKGIYAETSGGNIEIRVAKSVGANIDAATSGGDVECDLPVTVSGKISESRIKGTVNGGGSLIHAHTSGGDVRIRALD